MDSIVLGLIVILLLAGLLGGVRALVGHLLAWRRLRSGSGPILIAFDLADPGREEPVGTRRSLAREWAVDRPGREPGIARSLVRGEPIESVAVSMGSSRATSSTIELDAAPIFEGKTVRFHRPSASTMRLLPGRLEVEEGDDERSEIRFVDFPGEKPELTFGRSYGEPFRHVQLRSPTVSREHARMVKDGDEWVIINLSRTNPIVLNGESLGSPEERRVLHDSDRIEMGEVVFRFYAT